MRRLFTLTLLLFTAIPAMVKGQHELGKIKTAPIPEIHLSRDSVVYLDRNMAPLNKAFFRISSGFSGVMNSYESGWGLPGYLSARVDPVSGRLNSLSTMRFGLVGDADSMYKYPTTFLYYQEGDYQSNSLSAFQFLPVNESTIIRFGIDASGSYPQYFKNSEKDRLARIWWEISHKKSRDWSYSIKFDYFRNKGFDFSGWDKTEKVSTLLDFSRSISLGMRYKNTNLELGLKNTKYRAEDFLTIPSGIDRDTVKHSLYSEYENLFLKVDWSPGKRISLWSKINFLHGYKNRNLSNFNYAMLTSGISLTGKFLNIAAGLDHNDVLGTAPFAKVKVAGKARGIALAVQSEYRSTAVPFSFLHLLTDWKNDSFYRQEYFKLGGEAEWQLNTGQSLGVSMWTITPVNMYADYYTGQPQKVSSYWKGYLVRLNNGVGVYTTLKFEDFQDYYRKRIRRVTLNGRVSLKWIPRLPLTGYMFFQYYFDYPHYSFIFSTAEWIPAGKQDSPIISNLYLTLPVKSSLLYAAWTNVLQQKYELKNFDWTEFVAFKFGFIWRLEQ